MTKNENEKKQTLHIKGVKNLTLQPPLFRKILKIPYMWYCSYFNRSLHLSKIHIL